jgi:hypothetical protein
MNHMVDDIVTQPEGHEKTVSSDKRKREGTRPSNLLLQKRQDASRAAKLGVRCILAITSYRCDYSGSKNGIETKAHKTVRHQRTRYVYENQWRNQDGDSEEHRSIRISDH